MGKHLFKIYQQNQAFLLPPSLDELVAATHPVRVVSSVIDSIDIDAIVNKYKGGGATSYHPRMLLKVMVYGYLNNVYSSRRIEAALQENIHFMWLAGMSKPDHHTINRFRSERLKDVLKEVFAQIVLLLVDSGHVSLKEVYTDGTKIESRANRYTFVWGNAIKTNKEKIKEQLKKLWAYSQQVAAEEMDDDTPPDFDKIDSEKVKQTIDKIDAALKDKQISKQVKQKLNYARKNWPANLDKYKQQEAVLGEGRSSFSKTDPEATFMRMKEDYMKNGQLKPAYNVQISTNNQFIVNYSLHQSTNDTGTLLPHLEQHKGLYQQMPEAVIADAGYGSEENYQYLSDNNSAAYIKYNYFDKKQRTPGENKKPFVAENLYYNEVRDVFICPMGQTMSRINKYKQPTKSGFVQTITQYRAQNCEGCPLRVACHKQKGNRIIEINHSARILKQQASERLKSEQGIIYRKQRPADVEPVFANIKNNKGFRRFMTCGIAKTEVEWGLLSLAHNLAKMAA